jgi:O-antigen ligase
MLYYIIILFLYYSIEPILGLPPIFKVGTNSITLSSLLMLTLVPLLIANLFTGRLKINPRSPGLWFFLVLVLSQIIVAVFRPEMFRGALSITLQFSLMFLVLPLVSTVKDKKALLFAIWSLQVWGLIQAFCVYLSFLFPVVFSKLGNVYGDYAGGEFRTFGIMGDSVGWVLCLFAYWAIAAKQWLKFVFFTGAIVVTATLGAIILILVGFAIIFFRDVSTDFSRIKKYLFLMGFGCIALTASIGTLSKLTAVERVTEASSLIDQGSGAQRLWSYGIATYFIKENPIVGYGFGTYLYQVQKQFGFRSEFLKYSKGALSNANNQLLQSLYEVGILGTVVLLAMIFAYLKVLIKNVDAMPALFSHFKIASFTWLLSMLLFNQTAVWLNPSIVWFQMALVIGISLGINGRWTAFTRYSAFRIATKRKALAPSVKGALQ